MATEAQRRAVAKYNAKQTVQFIIRLNKETDKALIDKLKSVKNRQGYIKALIKADIEKGQG